MTRNIVSVPSVDGHISENGLIALVRCPQCALHHEHNVTVPGGYCNGIEPIDLGIHTSRCSELPLVQYRIVTGGDLSWFVRLNAIRQDFAMAIGALRRESRKYREHARRLRLDRRDQERLERSAKRQTSSNGLLPLSRARK